MFTILSLNKSQNRLIQILEDFNITLSNEVNSLIASNASLLSIPQALAVMSDLRVGSQMLSVTGNTATIRMYVDESINLNEAWSNTPHVLELDIPADEDIKFYRFRMD